MKSESGLSLLEIMFCLVLISISVLGATSAKNQVLVSRGRMLQTQEAIALAEKQLQQWQFCGAQDSSSRVNTCSSFDEITDFSTEFLPYVMSAKVTPISFTSDGLITLKKVRIEVRWQVNDGGKTVQKIEISSAFARDNLFSSLH